MKELKYLFIILLTTTTSYATDFSDAMETYVFESFRRALLGNIEIILDAIAENDEDAFLDGLDSLETFRFMLDMLGESDSTNTDSISTNVERLLMTLDHAKKIRREYPDKPFFDRRFYLNLPEDRFMKWYVMPLTTLFLIAKKEVEELERK